MEQKKELLKSRIEKIHDPVQKRLLQDVLVDVFGELLTYSEDCFAKLEQKIDGERCDPDSHYYIYTGVCKRDGLDSASRSLFEVQKEEGRTPGYLSTLFLACDFVQICRCRSGVYRAKVETDRGDYLTTVSLVPCGAYRQAFSGLYQQFSANQRQWHTLNCPFLYKLLDIIDRDGIVPADAVIARVGIELEEFSDFVMDDMALVWNVSEKYCEPKVDVTVAGNTSYYVHQIPLDDSQAGYLAAPEGEDLFSVVFSENGMAVRTEKEAHRPLKLLEIAPMNPGKDHTALQFPLQSNKRKLRHADRQALGQPRYLWTKGEVGRILSSYEVFRDFELVDVCPDRQGEVETVNMNPFIRLHSFLKQKRKIALVLHAKESTDIFRYEKMFFLLAELQLCTDEYEWTGILC